MIIMSSKKGVVINAAIIGAIIVGFLVINFFTGPRSVKVFSFENVGLQVPLKPLNDGATEMKINSLKDLRGQNILIHFWASWCESCVADHKAMERIVNSYHDLSTVKMIGIASSDTQKAIEESGMMKNITYPQFLEESGNLALAMGVKTLPQTLLIDSKGRLVYQLTRPFDPKQVEILENLLNRLNENKVSSFAFENSEGAQVTEQTLSNKVWVADFIFTNCEGACPMLTAKMRTIQEAFKNEDRLKFVSISVDPENDTREALSAYQKRFKVDTNQWHFLRGSMDEVTKLLVNSFKLGTLDDPKFHSGKFILVDQSNRVQGYFDPESSESMEKLKAEIRSLLK